MDDRLRALARSYRAAPDEEGLRQVAAAYRRAGADLPWDLLAATPRWRRITGFVRKWFKRPLEEQDGHSCDEIAALERRLGERLPLALREWFRLAGRRKSLTDDPQIYGDHSLPFEQIELEGGVLSLFGGSDEDVAARWGVRLDQGRDDPRVWLELHVRRGGDVSTDPMRVVGKGLSEFLLAAVLETYLAGLEPVAEDDLEYMQWAASHFAEKRFHWGGPVIPRGEDFLLNYTLLPVAHVGEFRTAFYGDHDTLLSPQGRLVSAVTRTPEATAKLQSISDLPDF